jgi:hypothetical protein
LQAFVPWRGLVVVDGSRWPVIVTQLLFDRQAQVLDQVEAIGDLPCRRGTLPGGLSIQTAPITADNLDRRMFLEPSCHGYR